MIYVDWNSTTPPHPRVLEAMREASADAWANPASLHAGGRAARRWVERARLALGARFGRHPHDVLLTGGGTEGNNLALRGLLSAGDRLVTSRLEHPSVVMAAEELARVGVEVLWAPVPESGQLSPAALADLAGQDRRTVICMQAVNHETGVLQPVHEVAEACRARGATFVCDAVQAVGKVDAADLARADVVVLTAHKFRGPKGIGALLVRPGLRLRPVLVGGAQERGVRPGTQDAVACAGFEAALARLDELEAATRRCAALRDALEAWALQHVASAARNGLAPRAPHVSNLSLPFMPAAELCAALDLEGVCVSSGSACSAGTAEPSPVVTAMVGEARARVAVRFSWGESSAPEDLETLLGALGRIAHRENAHGTAART